MPAILTMGSMLMMGMSSIMSGMTTVTNLVSGSTTFVKAIPSMLMTLGMIFTMLIIPALTKKYNQKSDIFFLQVLIFIINILTHLSILYMIEMIELMSQVK
mgnify:CR=1 FL=1